MYTHKKGKNKRLKIKDVSYTLLVALTSIVFGGLCYFLSGMDALKLFMCISPFFLLLIMFSLAIEIEIKRMDTGRKKNIIEKFFTEEYPYLY